MAARGARREDTCLLRARVMELLQVMSLMQVLLLVAQLLVEAFALLVKEVEEVLRLSFSKTPPPRTPP